MKLITISREFGSGGRELGKRLSDLLGFDYYDSEIIAAVAERSGLDAGYVASTLDAHGWQNYPISFGHSLNSYSYVQASRIQLLLQQRKVLQEIAALGKDCIIVGRDADVILEQYKPFRLFVCADTEAKLRRCRARTPAGENMSDKELLKQMKQIDKMREQTRELMSGSAWGERSAYDLTVNTGSVELKALAPLVRDYITGFWNAHSAQ